MTTQDVYIERAKAQLAAWRAEIIKMRAEVEAAQHSGQAEMMRQLDELNQRRDAAETELARLSNASDAAWTDMKASFDAAQTALADGFEKARKRYADT